MASHQDSVLGIALSPDGQWIVSAGEDGTVRVWDAVTGQPVGEPLKGPNFMTAMSVAFTPDARRIISGSADDSLRVWPGPAAWPDMLCAKRTRNVSHQQWREWVSPDIDYAEICSGLPIPPDAPR